MRLVITIVAALVLLACWPCSAWADYTAGEKAYHRGDLPRARTLLRAPATQGDVRARYLLGRMKLALAEMDGLRLLRASAQAGHPPAEFRMAMLHLNSMYVPFDHPRIVAWLQKVEGHDAETEAKHRVEVTRARFILAMLYRQGVGVRRDMAKGTAMLRRAADAGHIGAQFHFAEALEKGEGVKRDLIEAHKYFVLSWKEEMEGARARALAVRKRLTPEQFKVSRERVRAWLAAKDAGQHGWVFGLLARRSRGEKALDTVEGMHLNVSEMARVLAFSSTCEKAWVRSRRTIKPLSLRTRMWIERWTVDACGKSVYVRVTYRGKGKDVHWTVTTERPAAGVGAS